MLTKVRDNIFIGDEKVTTKELEDAGVTVIEFVGSEGFDTSIDGTKFEVFLIALHTDRVNKPYIKDIACHVPKYMSQNGEIVAIISKTGLVRAAFVACRAVCELEERSIYEVMVELKNLIPEYDIGKSYL